MKKSYLVVIVAGVFLLAGCGEKTADTGQSQSKMQESEKGGVINSIKDAMGLGTTMECTYQEKDENGKEIVSKAYVKGQQFKAINVVNGENNIVLGDDKIFYSWVEGKKTGEKFRLDCFDDKEKEPESNDSTYEIEEPINPEEEFEDATDVSCKEISGIDFSVPSDITFTDQCEAMRKAFDSPAYENLPANLPANMPNY